MTEQLKTLTSFVDAGDLAKYGNKKFFTKLFGEPAAHNAGTVAMIATDDIKALVGALNGEGYSLFVHRYDVAVVVCWSDFDGALKIGGDPEKFASDNGFTHVPLICWTVFAD